MYSNHIITKPVMCKCKVVNFINFITKTRISFGTCVTHEADQIRDTHHLQIKKHKFRRGLGKLLKFKKTH